MKSKQRLLAAIEGRKADRLPVTTHHIMPAFLEKYYPGMDNAGFFEKFGFDPIIWTTPFSPDPEKGQYQDPSQIKTGFLEENRICTDSWKVTKENIAGNQYKTERFRITTPETELSMLLQSDINSSWLMEHPIKQKKDIDQIAKYMPAPSCDIDTVNQISERAGDDALIRGHVFAFYIFGQPGCWQDACCLYGTEQLILETYDDPIWVKEFLSILRDKKIEYLKTTEGAAFDIMELGGGSASTTVISPGIFNEFVAPYDSEVIAAAHAAGQRIVYHTCGGMMAILEDIADMKPDAMETFTPPGMGGDADLAEAKRRVGGRVCMIGGFDQLKYFFHATEEETRASVRNCFREAGAGGGYILCPSDHFFDAKPELLSAFSGEAHSCIY